jgi:hypothetical protein
MLSSIASDLKGEDKFLLKLTCLKRYRILDVVITLMRFVQYAKADQACLAKSTYMDEILYVRCKHVKIG